MEKSESNRLRVLLISTRHTSAGRLMTIVCSDHVIEEEGAERMGYTMAIISDMS